MLIDTVYKLFTKSGDFFQEKTFYDLVIPTTLSILFLPFLYVLSLYVNYQNIWTRLPIFLDDNDVIKYAKYQSLLSFNFKTSLLRRWFDLVVRKRPDTKKEIDTTILEIKSILKREENPIEVSKDKGWSPYNARLFLEDEGLKTGHYKELYDGEWFASAPPLDIENILLTNIDYHIDGNRDIATTLKVKLNVFLLENEEIAVNYFFPIADKLCQKALGIELNKELEDAIFDREDVEIMIDSKKCSVKRDTLNTDGYTLKFTIKVIKET